MSRTERDGDQVQAVIRALGLLDILGSHRDGLRLSDLARAAGLSLSTAHRLLMTMAARGFAEAQADGTWTVGQNAFVVGSAFIQDGNFVASALPHLRHLRDLTRETANLGVLADGVVTILAQAESREITRAVSHVGGQVPAHVSAMGKAMLASLGDEEVGKLMRRHALRRPTPFSAGTVPEVVERLVAVRQDGYAIDEQEVAIGIRCVAAPVFDRIGDAVCAISVSGLTTRLTPERVAQIGALLRQTASRITLDIGGFPPPDH